MAKTASGEARSIVTERSALKCSARGGVPLKFDLTEGQKMLRKMVRNFAEKEIAPIAQEMDDKREFSYNLTRPMGGLQLLGPFVSQRYGGSNVGYISYIMSKGQLTPMVWASKSLNSMTLKDLLGRREIAFA